MKTARQLKAIHGMDQVEAMATERYHFVKENFESVNNLVEQLELGEGLETMLLDEVSLDLIHSTLALGMCSVLNTMLSEIVDGEE